MRNMTLAGIASLVLLSGFLLASSRIDYTVDLGAVVEIYADIVRDIDNVGLTVTRVSDEREMEIGEETARSMPGGRHSVAGERYISRIGEVLAKHVRRKGIHYRFHLVSSPEINAFAIPGGHVYVTTGMMDFVESEAEIAAIIGHEISHIDLRHCIERLQYELATRRIVGNLAVIVRVAHELIGVAFSEQQELEADANGVILAAKAGYDPRAGIAVFQRLALRHTERVNAQRTFESKRQPTMIGELGRAIGDALDQYFATHPPTPGRIRQLAKLYGRNERAWLGEMFYLGRSNLRDRVARANEDRPYEWTEYRQSPQLTECTLPPGYIVPLTAEACATEKRSVERGDKDAT